MCERPYVMHRLDTPHGELALRRHGAHFEVIANGTFLMDTSDGRSERLLVAAAVERMAAPHGQVLVGGLGVGFSLDEALGQPRVESVTVLEREPEVVRWNAEYFGRRDQLDDPRTTVIVADLRVWLAETDARFDALCLDVDNGPEWTVTPDNEALYTDAGLAVLADHLAPGGVLGVWAAAPSEAFADRLRRRFTGVVAHQVPVRRGAPDVVYLAWGPAPGRTA